jgi:uncharacterized protein (DUF1778 family)
MPAISRPKPAAADSSWRSPSGAKQKLIRLDAAELRLIERAASSHTPRVSSSWYIVQAAVERAQRDLRK